MYRDVSQGDLRIPLFMRSSLFLVFMYEQEVPGTIARHPEITNILSSMYEADYWTVPAVAEERVAYADDSAIKELEAEMKQAAEKLEFERAAELHDRIKAIKSTQIEIGIKT